jgi:hypothetical protein
VSIQTKDKLLQIRLERDLFDRISAVAGHHRMSLSALIRGYLHYQVDVFERKTASGDKWVATQASRSAAVQAAESLEKPSVEPVVASEGAPARKMH